MGPPTQGRGGGLWGLLPLLGCGRHGEWRALATVPCPLDCARPHAPPGSGQTRAVVQVLVPSDSPLRLTPVPPSPKPRLCQNLLKGIGGVKVAQACMGEDIAMIQKALGLVSCRHWCPQEGSGPLPPSVPLSAALGATQCEGPQEGRVGRVSRRGVWRLSPPHLSRGDSGNAIWGCHSSLVK